MNPAILAVFFRGSPGTARGNGGSQEGRPGGGLRDARHRSADGRRHRHRAAAAQGVRQTVVGFGMVLMVI